MLACNIHDRSLQNIFYKRTSKFDAVLFFSGKKREGEKITVLSVILERIYADSADTH